jgi:hypothetical protein
MMPLLRSATIDQHPSHEVARLRSLIDTLRTTQEVMTADIETEEQKSHICDVADISYSTLAKSLRARRDNLEATIALLKETLARIER